MKLPFWREPEPVPEPKDPDPRFKLEVSPEHVLIEKYLDDDAWVLICGHGWNWVIIDWKYWGDYKHPTSKAVHGGPEEGFLTQGEATAAGLAALRALQAATAGGNPSA